MRPEHKWRGRLLTGLCWFLALELFLFAPLKFYPGSLGKWPSYQEKFIHWGYPGWFRMVVGAAELLAAVLLLLPRRRFLGAALMVFILIGAVTTHFVNHDSIGDSISAPIHLTFAFIVALATWPADWRQLFAR